MTMAGNNVFTLRLPEGCIAPKSRKIVITADDLLPLRAAGEEQYCPDFTLRWAAQLILGVGPWGDTSLRWSDADSDAEQLAAAVSAIFDLIPKGVLEIDAQASELERFKHSVKVCLAILVSGARGGRRSDLEEIIKSLHKLVVAIDTRLHGFEEPLLNINRSPKNRRDDRYTVCVKTWCAIAGHTLLKMNMNQDSAARAIADVVNKNKFLRPKISGIAVVPRSIKNWMRAWHEGRLSFVSDAETEFREALDLAEKGKIPSARRLVTKILTERLYERKKFQLYPSIAEVSSR
jgi:hypothetical protein